MSDVNVPTLIKDIEKQFEEPGILGGTVDAEFFPTNIADLDEALGGGVPLGRILEIYGPESSGKTSTTLAVVAAFQAAGKLCAFVDVEHALNPSYAEIIGVDMEKLLVAQPDSAEQALNLVEALVVRGVDLVVLDSVSALVPVSELEGDVGDHVVGLHARLMSQAMRKLKGRAKKNNATVIFVNQIRIKIGVMFGSPETTSGGQALKFYSSQRLDVRKIKAHKEGDDVIGIGIRCRVVKNKVAPPFRVSEFDLFFTDGFDRVGSLAKVAIKREIIRKSGAFYYYPPDAEKNIAQGERKLSKYLQEHPEIYQEVMEKVLDA